MKAHGSPLRRAVFFDRDGVVNIDRGYVSRLEDFEFVPGFIDGARFLHGAGYALIVITNQSGIGRGLYTEQDFAALTDWLKGALAAHGAPLAGVYYCPHHPSEAIGVYRTHCDCRKPAPGLLLRAASELSLDLASSVMFGDRATDLEAARAAGVGRRILLATNGAGPAPALPPNGLATASYARLDEAVTDPVFIADLKIATGAE
jgi:D-glycero-D-manno-heptose 1,7-bisphosphate phosphatase